MQTAPQQRRVLQSKGMTNSTIMENEHKLSDSSGSVPSGLISNNTKNKTTSREVKALSLDTESSNYQVDNHHNNNSNDVDNDKDNDDVDDDGDETEPFDHNGLMHRNTNDERREYLKAKRMRRIKLWKESPFAIGLTEPTWIDERYRDYDPRADYMPDESGCLCMSARVCPLFGATRVGNMAVLKSSQEWVEEVEYDDETNEPTTKRYTRPRLDIVVGPYWPMLVFVTYPLILGVSGWTFLSGILRPGTSIVLRFVWTVCTITLIVSLARTAFCDPGILYRQRKQKDSTWRWSDQADTYRPRHAWYDMDTAVVIEGFDHTCPWTGTAIGRKNMFPFQMFVCMVFVCLILDIFILTGTLS